MEHDGTDAFSWADRQQHEIPVADHSALINRDGLAARDAEGRHRDGRGRSLLIAQRELTGPQITIGRCLNAKRLVTTPLMRVGRPPPRYGV